jgi:hypothetical protein
MCAATGVSSLLRQIIATEARTVNPVSFRGWQTIADFVPSLSRVRRNFALHGVSDRDKRSDRQRHNEWPFLPHSEDLYQRGPRSTALRTSRDESDQGTRLRESLLLLVWISP